MDEWFTESDAREFVSAFINAEVARIEAFYGMRENAEQVARARQVAEDTGIDAFLERNKSDPLRYPCYTDAMCKRYCHAQARLLNLCMQRTQIHLLVALECNRVLGEFSPYRDDVLADMHPEQASYEWLCELRDSLPPEYQPRKRKQKPRRERRGDCEAVDPGERTAFPRKRAATTTQHVGRQTRKQEPGAVRKANEPQATHCVAEDATGGLACQDHASGSGDSAIDNPATKQSKETGAKDSEQTKNDIAPQLPDRGPAAIGARQLGESPAKVAAYQPVARAPGSCSPRLIIVDCGSTQFAGSGGACFRIAA